MRILIFSTAYLPFIGGAELAIKEITDRISPADISFDLITLNLDGKQKKEERIGNVRVTRLSCPKMLFPFAAFVRASASTERGRGSLRLTFIVDFARLIVIGSCHTTLAVFDCNCVG